MKIEIDNINELTRIGSITLGTCVLYEDRYYILSDLDENNKVILVDLEKGRPSKVSLDTKVKVIKNAKVVN